MKVLIVEDNNWMRTQLELLFRRESYAVDLAPDAEAALAKVRAHGYDAIILDLGLPDEEGLDLLAELRKDYAGPVLIVTGRKTVPERVQGLDSGADDYLVKPIDGDELLARLRAAIRRGQLQPTVNSRVAIGDLIIDLARRVVHKGVDEIRLTHREFAILRLLVLRRGQVVALPALLEAVFAQPDEATPNAIHAYISRLRKRVGRGIVENVYGQGYLIR